MVGTPLARIFAGHHQEEEQEDGLLDFSEAENSQYVALLGDE
jgi:hypothetical protein